MTCYRLFFARIIGLLHNRAQTKARRRRRVLQQRVIVVPTARRESLTSLLFIKVIIVLESHSYCLDFLKWDVLFVFLCQVGNLPSDNHKRVTSYKYFAASF
ncbi:Zinc finger protein [Fusarium oxysporum f. sp. albedinis]|nr:Zinc finger protein [Fusarium oxysporum f. sp. albedinis]